MTPSLYFVNVLLLVDYANIASSLSYWHGFLTSRFVASAGCFKTYQLSYHAGRCSCSVPNSPSTQFRLLRKDGSAGGSAPLCRHFGSRRHKESQLFSLGVDVLKEFSRSTTRSSTSLSREKIGGCPRDFCDDALP